MIRAALPIVLFLAGLVALAQTEPAKTVSVAEAASHITQRVEPTVPPLAKAVKIGGRVTPHVIISPSGEVQSATFVSGHPLLIQAAIDAVKQWKFKPFLEGNSPIVVASDVELDFPGGNDVSNSRTSKAEYPALRALGFSQAGMHAFRHGWNRRWELSGLNPAIIRQQMGHSSATMTALYTGEIPLKEVRAAFPKVKNGLWRKMENEAAA